ncbi:MAG: helix-turn-helix transcriptional regulator [Candidatus Thiodiazotropha taylori]|uniref:Helix-turn-helix transcriptional regulator n=1 Tax=Candidatus Thiodiazotropha taylori TaxID=2792791 RepID=A0A9E4KBE5_9GAMM|nr:helix-turn-helix transcriptional regulator [Candidatus Thiodiazotropha taylori]MCW4255950.1 helix-turn-helix transcriptional regulator [Candidatus Thiodiazotropha taylori]
MAKVKVLDEVQLAACTNLNKIYQEKKDCLGLTHKKIAEKLGYKTHAAVTQILSAKRALTMELLIGFCELLQVPPKEICPVMGSRMEGVICAFCPYDNKCNTTSCGASVVGT